MEQMEWLKQRFRVLSNFQKGAQSDLVPFFVLECELFNAYSQQSGNSGSNPMHSVDEKNFVIAMGGIGMHETQAKEMFQKIDAQRHLKLRQTLSLVVVVVEGSKFAFFGCVLCFTWGKSKSGVACFQL